MAERINTIYLDDIDFELEGQVQLIGPRGETFILHKARPGVTERSMGRDQARKTLEEHATLAWPPLEKRLREAESALKAAEQDFEGECKNLEAYLDKFGEVGLSRAGLWPTKAKEHTLLKSLGAEELAKKKEEEREKSEEEKKKKQEEDRKKKEREEMERERIVNIERRIAERKRIAEEERRKEEKLRKEQQEAQQKLREAQLAWEQANLKIMFSHQKNDELEKAMKNRGRERMGGPTCIKCGYREVRRHWECPQAHLHYLVERK